MANNFQLGNKTFFIGDKIRIDQKIQEGGKERIQAFEGILIKIAGKEENKMITVRKIAVGGIGVEKIWPLSSPFIGGIKLVKRGKVRRAKLYYLRQKSLGKIKTDAEKERAGKSGGETSRQLSEEKSLSNSPA